MSHSPTTRAQHSEVQGKELQLRSITDQLTVLHSDLYWMAMEAPKAADEESPTTQLDFELLAGLKSAVDSTRLLLWAFIEIASQINPQKAEEALEVQRLQRSTKFLQLLRNRLGSSPEQEPVSFIERMSAAMKDRLGGRCDVSKVDLPVSGG